MATIKRYRKHLLPINEHKIITDYENNMPFSKICKNHNISTKSAYKILNAHNITDKTRNYKRKRNVTKLLLHCFEEMPNLTAHQISVVTNVNYNYVRFVATSHGYLTARSKRNGCKEYFDATPYKDNIINFLKNLINSQNSNSAFRSNNRRPPVVHL